MYPLLFGPESPFFRSNSSLLHGFEKIVLIGDLFLIEIVTFLILLAIVLLSLFYQPVVDPWVDQQNIG